MSESEGTSDHERARTLLSRISTRVAHIQKKAFGKGPVSTKSYMFDDMLLVVMRDSLTQAEQTMLGFGQPDLVRNFRQQFENEMTPRLVAEIEELTDRKVLTYQSQIMFDPDIVVEVFVFDRASDFEQRVATAQGQIDEDAAGEVSGDDA
jgi:uncharacterized protein YbcI